MFQDRNERKGCYKRLRAIDKQNQKIFLAYERSKRAKSLSQSYKIDMRRKDSLLEVENLRTWFYTPRGCFKAVDGISFSIKRGASLALVGESGCGKSVTSLSIMKLLSEPYGQIVGGRIRFAVDLPDLTAIDIVKTPERVMRSIRGKYIGMIFQESAAALDPVFTIGRQLDESIKSNNPCLCKKKELKDRSINMLETVEISNPERVYAAYPHELSGGMRQRVLIALALSGNPRLIIADEPTTALDVSVQAQILDLLQKLQADLQVSMILVTHDLGVVSSVADAAAVMYRGRIVEFGNVSELFNNPLHPYTKALLAARPSLYAGKWRLPTVPRTVGEMSNLNGACAFLERCAVSFDVCAAKEPVARNLNGAHFTSCHLYNQYPQQEFL